MYIPQKQNSILFELELKMSGKQNVIHLLSILYDNSSIYLDRKYNKYLDFIK